MPKQRQGRHLVSPCAIHALEVMITPQLEVSLLEIARRKREKCVKHTSNDSVSLHIRGGKPRTPPLCFFVSLWPGPYQNPCSTFLVRQLAQALWQADVSLWHKQVFLSSVARVLVDSRPRTACF